MSDNERICLMALAMTRGLKNAAARALLEHFGTAADVFAARHCPHEMAPAFDGVVPPAHIARSMDDALRRAEQEERFLSDRRVRLYALTDADYPRRLRECPDPPVAVYYKGTADLNAPQAIGIVGTRHATEYGLRMTEDLLRGLTEAFPDLLVVSGLAYGIDICAHRTALQVGMPTVGVVAHGLDRVYPEEHRETAARMMARGGLFSEYPSETRPSRDNFLRRNRLIAGLSDVVVVVESSKRGGALTTAAHALAYGREVYAFPGRVGDERSVGCNHLIHTKRATLISSSNDLIRSMIWDARQEGVQHRQLQLPFME